MDIEQQFGIKIPVLLAGLIGGVVSLTYETKISLGRAILLILGGASTAAYLQPVAQHYLGFQETFSSGLGFVLGLVSMKLIAFLIQNTEKFLKKIVPLNGSTNSPERRSDAD